MGRGRSTPQGMAIAARTRVLSHALSRARVAYWESLLVRPQLVGPILDAIALDVDLGGWGRRLSCLRGYARRWIATRRVGDRRRYLEACTRVAEWLATRDRACGAANAITDALALWSGRRLPRDHHWHGHRLYPARTQSGAWRAYWGWVTTARRERERLRNEIVTLNEGLVIHFCSKWAPWAVGHLSREDLHQVAREGLFRAADLYEHDRQPPRAFSTYAAWWLQHHVWREHSRRRGDIVAPIATQQLALKISPIVAEHGPDVAIIHAALVAERERKQKGKIATPEAIRQALEYMGTRAVSLQDRVGRTSDGQGLTLADVIPDDALPQDEQIDAARVMARLLASIDRLPAEQREVVALRYGLDGPEMTVAEIATQRGRRRDEIAALERLGLDYLRGAVAS
jgi:RNA polymerase sigma factor (sigma-70 family)